MTTRNDDTPSVPPVNATAVMLATQIEYTEMSVNSLTEKIRQAEEHLDADRRALAESEAHLRRMQTLATIVAGRVPVPAPREVCEFPDGSVRIGVLVFPHPGADATEDDLRFFAASMRAIYDVATPAATKAIALANAKRHQSEQADVPTGAFPVAPAADTRPDLDETPWAQMVGKLVAVRLSSGVTFEGIFEHMGDEAATFLDPNSGAVAEPLLADVASITPVDRPLAEVADQVPATPAQAEAVRSDG